MLWGLTIPVTSTPVMKSTSSQSSATPYKGSSCRNSTRLGMNTCYCRERGLTERSCIPEGFCPADRYRSTSSMSPRSTAPQNEEPSSPAVSTPTPDCDAISIVAVAEGSSSLWGPAPIQTSKRCSCTIPNNYYDALVHIRCTSGHGLPRR